jgi:hypothetical protein
MKTNQIEAFVSCKGLKIGFSLATAQVCFTPRRAKRFCMGTWLAMALVTCASQTQGATIGASGDMNMPSTLSTYSLGTPINETIAFDPGSGPWLKDLVNGGSGISSGANVLVSEVLLNGGQALWTDWHEQVVSRTTIDQPDDAPGFLFRTNSISVKADYGSGFISLSEGTDYTLVGTPTPAQTSPLPTTTVNGRPSRSFLPQAGKSALASCSGLRKTFLKCSAMLTRGVRVKRPGSRNSPPPYWNLLSGHFALSVSQPSSCGATGPLSNRANGISQQQVERGDSSSQQRLEPLQST